MELKDYLNVIYARKWVIIGTVLLVLLGTLVVSLLQEPVYESSVLILAEVNEAGESASDSVLALALKDPKTYFETQAEIIGTRAMATAVRDRLEYQYEEAEYAREEGENVFIPEAVPSVEQLMASVRVARAGNTTTFHISATGTDPYLARDVAQAYADEYILDRQLSSIKQISDARKEVWNSINELETQIMGLSDEIRQYNKDSIPPELEAEAAQAVSLWGTYYEKYMTLRIAEALEQRGLEVIEVAEAGGQVSPRTLRNLVLALFVGLLLGLGLAFLADYLDATLKTREEVERYYQAPIIGEIARVSGIGAGDEEQGILYFSKPTSPSAEGFRNLRTNLQFLNMDGKTSLLMVTSASPEEGKTSVAVNLGAALSETGKRVMVVEADLRRPVIDRYLPGKPGKGLTDLLMGAATLEDAVIELRGENVRVITSGVIPPNPAELVSSEAMRDLLERLREAYDYVIVDAPPVLAVSDAIAMAPMMDGVVMVAGYGISNRDGARHTVELLSKVETRVLGVVINNVKPSGRYGYSYPSYPSYGSAGPAGSVRDAR